MKCPAPSTTSTHAPGMRSAESVEAPTGIGLREPWTKPTGTRIRRQPGLERRELGHDRRHHLASSLDRHAELGHRRRRFGIRVVRRPDEAHPLERQLDVGLARHAELVDLPRALARLLRRAPEHLLVELRPASVADGAERIDGEHTEEPVGHRLGDVEREVAAPGVPDDVRLLPAERVEHAAGVADVRRDRVGPFHCRRLEPSLLVPRDVVLLCELVGQVAQVAEAEAGSTVQQDDGRAAAGAQPADQRPSVVRRELGPGCCPQWIM